LRKCIFDYQKLKGRIVEKKEKQENLANEIGITKTTLNYKLNNKIAFKQSEIIVLSNLLDIPRDEIIEYFFTLKV
jgi:DNA-binding XRE family transcriptional regulator